LRGWPTAVIRDLTDVKFKPWEFTWLLALSVTGLVMSTICFIHRLSLLGNEISYKWQFLILCCWTSVICQVYYKSGVSLNVSDWISSLCWETHP
jgi:hypothetical protein